MKALKTSGRRPLLATAAVLALGAAALLAQPGASAYYVGGAVNYTRVVLLHLSGMRKEELEKMRGATILPARCISAATKISAARDEGSCFVVVPNAKFARSDQFCCGMISSSPSGPCAWASTRPGMIVSVSYTHLTLPTKRIV